VRTALGSAISTAEGAAEAASDAAGAAAAAAAASIPVSALVTSVGSPGSNSDVPSEAAVRTAISDAISGSGFGSGDVAGPASATAGHVATYADGSGKVIADGGAPNTLAVANLGGGAETVGGSGGNGTAATAARSDHTHAINAISAATESVAGLMAAADKTKLDGIAGGATALSLANLGGGAETVGGSGSNGTAATAARSDHTHAINSIGEVTESADGLMIAADKAKLDGIAAGATALSLANLGGGAEAVGGSASNGSATTAARSDHKHAITQPAANAGRWVALVAGTDFTAVPASTSTITMLTNQTANIQPGMALQFVVGGSTYYCQCTAITSSLLTVRGTTLGSSALTSLAYDSMRQTAQYTLFIGTAWTSTGVSLAAALGQYLGLGLNKSHLIGWRGTLGVKDTGAAQPYVQPYLNGALVCNSTQMSATPGTFVDGGVWTGDVSLTYGQAIDVQCPTLGTNKTANQLNLELVFVQE
jgi:hypothetical protein